MVLCVTSNLLLKFNYFRMIAILWGRDFETKSMVLGFLIAKTSLENITVHLRVIVFLTYVLPHRSKTSDSFQKISEC